MRWFVSLSISAMSVLMVCPLKAQNLSQEQRALHVLNRLAFGPQPGDVDRVIALGVERYIDQQLNPEKIQLSAALVQGLHVLPIANAPAGEVLAELINVQKAAQQADAQSKLKQKETIRRITQQTAQARLLRAIESPRQLEEVMVDFWFNHFNVFEGKGFDRALVASYERDAIRPYVLGRFRDLLGATAKHPAMLFYLDNWVSTAHVLPANSSGQRTPSSSLHGLNENYARELMELHTLGVDGGYRQKDVTELARIFTGWTFVPNELIRDAETFHFESRRHDQTSKEWLGHTVFANGQTEGEWALDILAMHPATARRISYQLAQYFVADQPPPVLVERLSLRFLDTQGDIRAVLRTLFDSSEFWDVAHVGAKFKTPYQYVISAMRASDRSITNFQPLLNALTQLGMPLYGCQTPDGYKNTEEAWLNPEALSRRINFATALAAGRLPIDKQPDSDSAPGAIRPLDADSLLVTLGASVSRKTSQTVASSPPALRAALLLGSPDFMRH